VVGPSTNDWRADCAAVIPCLNEAAGIFDVVSRTRAHLPTVLVVDDGSSDATAQQAAAAGAVVVRQPGNLGKGVALRTGFEQAKARGLRWVLTLDGDGQHAPEDIPRFFRCAEASRAALVIGNRLCEPEKIPWVRRCANRWMSRQISRLTNRTAADSQCGFRLIHLEAIEGLKLSTDRFEIESELIVQVLRAGLGVEYVPVQVIYNNGKSEIRPLVDTWRWLRWRSVQVRSAEPFLAAAAPAE
jgi:glycosyltransferase involved in cell wall biosynthesis